MGRDYSSIVSIETHRPSPLSAPTLQTNPGRRKRQTSKVAYYDEQPTPALREPPKESKGEFHYQPTSALSEPPKESKGEFHYKPTVEPKLSIGGWRLPPNPEPWIRLLKIPLLGDALGFMKPLYELITVPLHAHPPYKAISYAWGNPVNTEIVSVIQDDREGYLRIPVSLGHALQAIRHDIKDILVWVDSICINQKDNHDKTQQLSLIPDIYSQAEQVVVWLGGENGNSAQAHKVLHGLAHAEMHLNHDTDLSSIISLFDRDYWSRLWVVQEILHARDIVVQCGQLRLTWYAYTQASRFFQKEKGALAKIPGLAHGSYDSNRLITSQHRLSPLQILVYHGPASILHIQQARKLHSDDPFFYFLHLLRLSRTKLALDPKDRVYGILGILPDEVRAKLRVNYLLPVREIYLDVVEILLRSGNMDVICESIHYPPQISNANLPSWVPDWSYDPVARSLASLPLNFSAGSRVRPSFSFYSGRTRSKLSIGGKRIGTIDIHGMAVNTHSRAADYCMAFLQWRVLLLQHFGIDYGSANEDSGESRRRRVASCEHQRRFCLTLSLGQPIRDSGGDKVNLVAKEEEWLRKAYCVFAKTIKARLPMLPIDEDLTAFADGDTSDMEPKEARQFLQDSFAEYMMGRAFCITDSGSLGLGSGAMARGDVVVVPHGCSAPVILRPEGSSSENGDDSTLQEYRFVGDAYIHGCMDGEALEEGSEEVFLLH